MYEVLVLGIIPGTDIQITFLGWLMAAISMIALRTSWLARKKHTLLWVRLYIELFAIPLRTMPRRQQTAS